MPTSGQVDLLERSWRDRRDRGRKRIAPSQATCRRIFQSMNATQALSVAESSAHRVTVRTPSRTVSLTCPLSRKVLLSDGDCSVLFSESTEVDDPEMGLQGNAYAAYGQSQTRWLGINIKLAMSMVVQIVWPSGLARSKNMILWRYSWSTDRRCSHHQRFHCRQHVSTRDTSQSQPLDVMYVDHAALIRMIGAGFTKDILATRDPSMAPCLTNFELLSAAPRFACICVVLVVGMVTNLTDPFCSGTGRHSDVVLLCALADPLASRSRNSAS
jgi:hypothetical protein